VKPVFPGKPQVVDNTVEIPSLKLRGSTGG
jgi:hypothetical protein